MEVAQQNSDVAPTVSNDLNANAGADRGEVPASVASRTGSRRNAERDVL
jgi:hypothetical protein